MSGPSVDTEATQALTSSSEELDVARTSAALGIPPVQATGGPLAIRPAQLRDRGRYELLGEHGRGALGRVTRAHDVELGRDVAIKELISRDHASEARFLREALITARLEHPGIVAVHEAGRWPDGTPFYAMKLVSGRPLRELIAERKTVAERIGLLHHVIAVADAIAYAHGRNVIHRDLKPANIIVGDFGETVVIDWGLAKDLTVADEPPGPGIQSRATDRELTQVGAVLGTPAYMAPEQERGEPVDQRADVYAIGVMLWELCAPTRIIPEEARHRDRELRRAGIDHDLTAIIGKALAPDPAHRYRDAAALAHDLKAFKAGARITARSYSPAAMLARWTRRHRALASVVVTVVVLVIGGSLAYVRNIAIARDRADLSEASARRAQAASESSLDQLTLNHAQLLLATDPSAALDALASYHGADTLRASQVRAEAIGHGVALLRAVPHTGSVLWAEGTVDGAIVSLSADGTIAQTSRDGTSRVIARGVAKLGLSSYARSRRLLAYTCDGPDLCLLDVPRELRIPVASVLQGSHVADLSFSPDGMQLAVISQDAVLRVLDLANPAQPTVRFTRPIAHGEFVKFVDDNVIAVASATGVTLQRLTGDAEAFALPGIVRWEADAPNHQLALATASGQAVVLAGFPLRVEARSELCHGLIFALRFLADRGSVAYACRAGSVGVWDLRRGTVTPRVQLEGVAGEIATSPEGDYIIATSGNGTITVLDLTTDLIALYKGHGFRPTAVTEPTAEHPFVISGDAHGAVRVWPLPPRLVRVAASASLPFNSAIFDHQSTTVTATTLSPELTTYSLAGGAQTIRPHEAYQSVLERSGTDQTFAAYGFHDAVEVWSAATLTRTRVIPTGHDSVSQLHFVGDTGDFITSGNDGRLVRWTPSGDSRLITRFDQAIDNFAQATPRALIASTMDGVLWRVDEDGRVVSVRSGGARVNQLLVSSDHQTAYAGYADGSVVAIDTASWRQATLLRGDGAVQAIDVTDDGQTLAVATDDGAVHVGTRAQPGGAIEWVTLAARARHVALAPDGTVVAACTDGTIWLYSPAGRRWICLVVIGADLNRTVVAPNGNAAVTLDRGGRLLWIDLESARQQLLAKPGTSPRT